MGYPKEIWVWLYAKYSNDSGKPVPRRARGAWDNRALNRCKSDKRYIREDEYERLREYLLEASGRLHQIASERQGLPPRDLRAIANDMARIANRAADKVEAEQ